MLHAFFPPFFFFLGNFSTMVLFCYLLYDSFSDSLNLFFVPLADVSFLCPNSGLFSSPFFICFLSPAGRQMGNGLLGTENVMERFSSHPTMRTGCSCDISLQIEEEHSEVPNGTFLGLLYFHWHSEKSSKMFVEKFDVGLTARF